jgi:mono/diheme cytochrome c family protein
MIMVPCGTSSLITVCLLGTILMFGYDTRAAHAEKTSRSNSANIGETIYQANCAVCHGDSGNGQTWVSGTLQPPPRNFTDPDVIQTLTRERMHDSITNGRPGTGMQPWKSRLSEDQIHAVIDYIRATFMKIDPPHAEKTKTF